MSVSPEHQGHLDSTSPSTLPAGDIRNHDDAQHQGSSCDLVGEESALKSLLKDLPQPFSPNFYATEPDHMPQGSKDSGWQHCLKAVEKHDRDLCQAYREQIDTLLVFAGLFSAVVTAFAIESYQWLLDDPADTSAELLRDITRLLAHSLNQTAPAALPSAPHLPSAAVTRINVFWFLSLTLSLSAALVGILCKQWLREFERDVGQSPEIALAVRHIRFQGLNYWKVGSIVNSVPIVLQVSLALFLSGVVELLWRLHSTVAIFATLAAGITLVFYLATTVLPLLQYTVIILRLCGGPSFRSEHYTDIKAFGEPQCAFKSAQAWLALRTFQPVIEYLIRTYCTVFMLYRERQPTSPVLRPADSWVTFDLNWIRRRDYLHWGAKTAYKSLAWVAEHLEESLLSSSIWHCIWARWLQNRDDYDELEYAAMDMERVARAYAEPVHIDVEDVRPHISGPICVFRCSLRSTISVGTAVESMLRVAPVIGVDSKWTCEAAKTILVVYHDLSIHLSDDMTIGLFHLAQLQTQAIIQRQGAASENLRTHDPIGGFFWVFQLLLKGASCRERILPAMCALSLQWLRSHPPWEECGELSEIIIRSTIDHLAYLKFDPARLPVYPGIIFPARLARMVADLSRGFARYEQQASLEQRIIFRQLMRISRMDPNDVAFRDSSDWSPPSAPPVEPYRPGEGRAPPDVWDEHIAFHANAAKQAELKKAAASGASPVIAGP